MRVKFGIVKSVLKKDIHGVDATHYNLRLEITPDDGYGFGGQIGSYDTQEEAEEVGKKVLHALLRSNLKVFDGWQEWEKSVGRSK